MSWAPRSGASSSASSSPSVGGYVQGGEQWADVVVFSILILVLVFRPTGLLGMRVPEK